MNIEQMRELREPIVEECKGCSRVEKVRTTEVCIAYMKPSVHWRLGDCGLSTHKREIVQEVKKYKPGKFGKKRRNK